MKPQSIVLPPLRCECGSYNWFRIKKGRFKNERLYACQDCGKEERGIVHAISGGD